MRQKTFKTTQPSLTYEPFDKAVLSRPGTVAVTDETLSKLYGLKGPNVFILPPGEECKSFFYLEKLCAFMLDKNLGKTGALAAVGGGSVGDLAGLAAAVFKRGVPFINYPTTLLAMVDSSIGGKTAIDLMGVKNAVGAFCYGKTVIDFSFLQTLPSEQIVSAWGEIAKYTFLSEQIHLAANDCLTNGKPYTEELIRLCTEYKYGLAMRAKVDGKARRRLNMGHTFGHAFESIYRLPHGTAVLNGLYYELLLAKKVIDLPDGFAENRLSLLKNLGEIQKFPVAEKLLPLIQNDKKNADGKICFVLPLPGCGTKEVYLSPQRLIGLLA